MFRVDVNLSLTDNTQNVVLRDAENAKAEGIDAMTNQKPVLPPNPTHEQIVRYENEMFAYEEEMIRVHNALSSARGSYMKTCANMGHTIDRLGRRVVFRVINSRGAKRHFDKSVEAVKFAREAVNQPTRMIVIPVLPSYSYWSTPLMELVKLIEGHENDRRKSNSHI